MPQRCLSASDIRIAPQAIGAPAFAPKHQTLQSVPDSFAASFRHTDKSKKSLPQTFRAILRAFIKNIVVASHRHAPFLRTNIAKYASTNAQLLKTERNFTSTNDTTHNIRRLVAFASSRKALHRAPLLQIWPLCADKFAFKSRRHKPRQRPFLRQRPSAPFFRAYLFRMRPLFAATSRKTLANARIGQAPCEKDVTLKPVTTIFTP